MHGSQNEISQIHPTGSSLLFRNMRIEMISFCNVNKAYLKLRNYLDNKIKEEFANNTNNINKTNSFCLFSDVMGSDLVFKPIG